MTEILHLQVGNKTRSFEQKKPRLGDNSIGMHRFNTEAIEVVSEKDILSGELLVRDIQ